MTHDFRRAEEALRPVGGVEEIQVVGALSDGVARLLGLITPARSVLLHPSVVHHIHTQRGVSRGDAEFVLSHLPAAILRPHHCGADPRTPGRYDLVHLPSSSDRAVFVAIKVVIAADAVSASDELWVSTGHPLSGNFLTRKRYRESLIAVPHDD